MGRKSTRENKNIYQISRESLKYSRDEAVEKMKGQISMDRLLKIEYDQTTPHPEEILAMATAYQRPALRNYYCSHDCLLGREFVPEVKVKNISQITLEMAVLLNTLHKDRERLMEITVDGKITDDEIKDFTQIKQRLHEMSAIIDSLDLWIDENCKQK